MGVPFGPAARAGAGVPVRAAAAAGARAGLGAGVWSDAADMAATWTSDATVDPSGDRSRADAEHLRWQEAVRRSQDWAAD